MNYDEVMEEGVTVTAAQAKAEIDRHDSSLWPEFIAAFGQHETYSTRIILTWLGW